MSLDLFIPFLIATAILLATPGPTILLVVSYALTQGRGVALAVVGGVILGDLLAMSATLPVAVSSLIVAMLLQPLSADWPQWTLARKV